MSILAAVLLVAGCQEPAYEPSHLDVIRYAFVANHFPEQEPFHSWLEDQGWRPAQRAERGLADLLLGLDLGDGEEDWWRQDVARRRRVVPNRSLVTRVEEGPSGPELVFSSPATGRSAQVAGFEDRDQIERVGAVLTGAREGQPAFRVPAADRERVREAAWAALHVLDAVDDEVLRFRLTTWLDDLSLTGPLLSVVDIDGDSRVELDVAADDEALWRRMHRRVRPELEVRRRELTWLTRAARLLESHDVAPDYAGARAWFAESSLVYDLHRRGAAYPSKGRVRSDLVDRVALALHVAAEQLGGGPTPAYAHGPPYFVVDAAVFLSSGPEDEEDRGELAALAAVRELRASPPDEVRVFIAAREAARLEPIWEDLGGFDIWFPHAPETPLTVHEVIADWVRVGETRRWPFLASEGGFGLSQEASDLMDARSGDVLGPYGFEGGWAVLRVNAVLQERSRAPRRGVLPPLVPFPARLDAVRELDRRIAQQGG